MSQQQSYCPLLPNETAPGPERQFRKIISYRDLANLAVAVEREVARSEPSPVPAPGSGEEVPEAATV